MMERSLSGAVGEGVVTWHYLRLRKTSLAAVRRMNCRGRGETGVETGKVRMPLGSPD